MNPLWRQLFLILLFLSFPHLVFAQSDQQWAAARRLMVQREVVAAGIKNQRVCDAILATPRHFFVPNTQRANAYYDMALPIGHGQTISPPFVVAYMTEQLDPQPKDKVLEIGTGSGYQAAVLSELVADVYSIEIVAPLGRNAASVLKRLNYDNVHTKIGDGFQGWAEHAPFDKIIVTCSPEKIPRPLIAQLREGGKIVVPLGERYQQALYRFTKQNGKLKRELLRSTFFVPMTGRAESLREVDSDSAIPELINGSFEQKNDQDEPTAWYYVRQAKSTKSSDSRAGEHYLRCTNAQAGRGSQALQAVGVDGRVTKRIDVSLWVRCTGVRPGQSIRQLPRFEITFFDERRSPVGKHRLGPWHGATKWSQKKASIAVPPKARLAVVMLGMFGAVGEVGFDQLVIEAAP